LVISEESVIVYRVKANPIACSSDRDVIRQARKLYEEWLKASSGRKGKRRPAVRSKSLKTDRGQKRKIFINTFQEHLKNKNMSDVARRLKLLPCVRDFLENANQAPKNKGIDYIFTGRTPAGMLFRVVVREKKSGLYLLTFYPSRK